jgi:hypothetical protein
MGVSSQNSEHVYLVAVQIGDAEAMAPSNDFSASDVKEMKWLANTFFWITARI